MLPANRASTGGRRRRAVVVDDDLPTLRLLSELAASAGLEPVAFTRLAPARRAVRESPPSVLVVDDDLPDGRGADLAAEVRRDPRLHGIRVLICTAADQVRRRELSGIGEVLPKPFGLAQLERALQRAARD